MARTSKWWEPGGPVRRTATSLLSSPQQAYVPHDQMPSWTRSYDAAVGRIKAVLEGRFSRRDCRKDRSRGVIVVSLLVFGFAGGEFAGGWAVGWIDMWACAAVPPMIDSIQ